MGAAWIETRTGNYFNLNFRDLSVCNWQNNFNLLVIYSSYNNMYLNKSNYIKQNLVPLFKKISHRVEYEIWHSSSSYGAKTWKNIKSYYYRISTSGRPLVLLTLYANIVRMIIQLIDSTTLKMTLNRNFQNFHYENMRNKFVNLICYISCLRNTVYVLKRHINVE